MEKRGIGTPAIMVIVIIAVTISLLLLQPHIFQEFPSPATTQQTGQLHKTPAITEEPIRLAAHEFIPVGDRRDLGNMGEILEVMQFGDEKISVDTQRRTVQCISGGVAGIRAQYRESDIQNEVQTKIIACIEETGPCEGEKPLSFDLQQFTDRQGNANWLEPGENTFFGVCEVNGKIRLQQPAQQVPLLYFVIVDAFGEGAYSLGGDEYAPQRRGTITTYSGDVISPNWIIPLGQSLEHEDVFLDDEARIHMNDPDCDQDPACTTEPGLVQDGDIVQISWGLDLSVLESMMVEYEEQPGSLDILLQRHGIAEVRWSDIPGPDNDVKRTAFARMVSLQVTDNVLHYFDSIYDLSNRDVVVVYAPQWYSRSIVDLCYPTDVEYCRNIENTIMAAEARQIETWKDEGFDLWVGFPMDYRIENGNVEINSWHRSARPHFSNFNGMLARLSVTPSDYPKEDVAAFLPTVMKDFSNEIKTQTPDMPVIVMQPAPPLASFTEASFCEADFCPSDFRYSYLFTEIALRSLSEDLGDNFAGFGVAMFEGAHFDIRQLVENKEYELNRVGETGYNNPVLNMYAAQ